jgi:hypothetical protein
MHIGAYHGSVTHAHLSAVNECVARRRIHAQKRICPDYESARDVNAHCLVI